MNNNHSPIDTNKYTIKVINKYLNISNESSKLNDLVTSS